MDLLKRLAKEGRIHPPKWLIGNINFVVKMGSYAYGCHTDESDNDIYGFCTPPVNIVYPHKAGIIQGFGNQGERFDQWSEHHIKDKGPAIYKLGEVHPFVDPKAKEYDFSIYNIVKFFQLAMDNNPNMVDFLFVPRHCILYTDKVGELIREQRHIFLHKGCWHKFKGYAYSQMQKMKHSKATGNRKKLVDEYGFDVKFAYHVVRLMLEVEQILAEGDLDLQRHNEILKAIRRGDWSLEKVERFFEDKERDLESLYKSSKLPYKPDEQQILGLLRSALNMSYPDHVETKVINPAERKLELIKGIIDAV